MYVCNTYIYICIHVYILCVFGQGRSGTSGSPAPLLVSTVSLSSPPLSQACACLNGMLACAFACLNGVRVFLSQRVITSNLKQVKN